MFTTRNASILSLTLALAASHAPAQDFGATVATDPKAGTATYTIDLDGPPKGFALAFVSLGLAPSPFQLPGLGPLFLDPRSILQLPLVPLGPVGKRRVPVAVPLPAVQGATVLVQPLFIDPAFNLRFAPKAVALGAGAAGQGAGKPGYMFMHESNRTNVCVQFLGQKGGRGSFEIFDKNGKLIGYCGMTIGADGKSPVTQAWLHAKVTPGCTWVTRYSAPGTKRYIKIGSGKF